MEGNLNSRTFDVVCGASLEKPETEDTSIFEGVLYYFCSPECKEKFETTPVYYAGTKAA